MKMPTLSSKKDETNSNKTALPLPTVSSKAAAKEPTAAVKPLPSISNTDNWQRLTAAQQARQQADAAVKHTASVAAREFPAINDQNVEDYEQWVYGQMVKNNWTDEQLAAALGSRKRQSATNLALQAVSNSQPSMQAVPISKEMLTLPSVTRIKGRDGTADTPTAYIQSVFDRSAEKKTAEENKRGFLPRLADTVKGGAKGSLASNVNAIANAYDLNTGSGMDQYVREQESAAVESYQRQAERFAAEYREMLEDNRRTPGKWSDAVLENQRTKAENAAKATGVLLELKGSDYRRGAADAVYELADTIQQSSAEDIERAKKGLGTFGEMVVDAGASMTQVGLDALANTATGGQTMIPFALRAYGGGAQQARQNGAGLKGASLYGAASAAKEIFTEKMFNIAMPFAKAYGGGTWDDAVETAIGKAVDKLAKTEAGSRLLGGALTLGAGAISEGLEELIGDWLEWQMPRIYGGDVDSAAETLSQSLYDFAVGTLSGAMGGVADGGTYNYGAPKYLKGPADFADTGAAESQTGNLTPATNRAAETQKNSALEERTEVNDDPAQHSVAEQSVIEEYTSAVNQRLLTWVDRVRAAFASGDSSASKMRLLLGEVKPNTAQAIQAVSGIDVNGFRHMIDGAAVQHDERRHGAHGTADHSMENAEDVARIEYVLDNFDAYDLVRWPDGSPRLSGQYRDKNNRPAPLVMFQKKVDGTYYAVEAVPDSADRKLHIVSAYMNKASESIIQELNMRDQSPPQLTPETPLGPIASAQANFIIQQKSNAVKSAVEEMKIFPSTAPAESGVKRFSAYGTTDAARQAQFQRAEQIAEKFGARFQVAELASGVDGEYQNGIITISPNVQNPVTAVLVHELTHHMESSGRYGEFSKMVLNHIAREYDVGVDELKKEIRARYAEAGIQLDDTGAEREIVARFAQENLFQNEETINHLARENHSLAQMIRDWLADLAVKLKGTEEERFVRNAERLYEKALRGVVGNSDMTQGEYLYVRPSRSAIAVAEAQETIGLADEAIRRDTGLHRSMDGQWRAEIDDSNARYLDSDLRGRTLGEVLDHEELYRIYPWLRDIEVEHTMFGTSAYDPATDRIMLNDMQIAGASKSEKRALVLHEVQHAIQEHEGFARGSSEGYWRALRAEGVLPEELKNQSDRDLYLRTAGEIEARDAANRASMDEATRYLTAPDLGDGRALNEPRYLPAPSLGDGKYSLGRGIDDLTAHYLAAPNLNGMALEDGTRVSPEIAEALERMQNRTQPVTDNPAMGKADFTGTRALQKLGVKIANSVGLYQNLEQLKGQDRAAKQVAKERRRAESRLDATKAERTFARGIMDGLYTEADIPASMDRAKVTELADYYRAEQQTSDDRIKGVRRTINRELEGAMAHLFRDSDRFKPESGFVMSYRTPQRIMNAIFGETRAKAINEAIFNPVAENEAERIRFINRMFDEVRTFQGKDGKASELTTEESALVQQVIEGKAAAEEVAGLEMRSAIESAAQKIQKDGWT
ncbi:MAG: hypothetical protein IJV64_10215, partial [Oscillospiraceae bacterium]|nr:hypothetical protein [Oscillospiraceae bacterium]